MKDMVNQMFLHIKFAFLFIGFTLCNLASAQSFSVNATVNHIYSNSSLGSILLSTDSPNVSYLWSNSATGSSISNLTAGYYSNTATNGVDTLITNYNVGYYPEWDTLINVSSLLKGGLQSNSIVSGGIGGYAFSLNSLAPSQNGWVHFHLFSGNAFSGLIGMTNNMNFDQSSDGSFALGILDGNIIVMSNASDGFYWGSYDSTKVYDFGISVDEDSIHFSQDEFVAGVHTVSYVSFPNTRNENMSVAFVPFSPTSSVGEIACSFKSNPRTKIYVIPGAKNSGIVSFSSSVKGGVPPYNYLWSNTAITDTIIGVPVGEYSLTVTDAENVQSIAHQFGGQFATWDTLFNTGENEMHELTVNSISTLNGESEEGGDNIIGLCLSKNRLKMGENGSVNFQLKKGSDFSGAIGLVHDLAFEGGGLGLAILPQGEGEGDLSGMQQLIFMNGDNPVNLGPVFDEIAFELRIKRQNSVLYFYKNNVMIYSLPENEVSGAKEDGDILPDVSPVIIFMNQESLVQSVTCDFGEREAVLAADVTHCAYPVQNSLQTLGVISFEYDSTKTYSWSNGENGNSIDSLLPGEYYCSVTGIGIDSTDTLVKQFNVGYYPQWDLLNKTSALTKGGIQSEVTGTSSFDGYAYALNALRVDDDGWCSFKVESGVGFEGVFGLTSNVNFDESTDGFGIGVIGASIMIFGSEEEKGGLYFGEYNPSNTYHFSVNIKGNDVFVFKDAINNNEHITSAIRFSILRNSNISMGVLPFNGTSKINEIACSFDAPLRATLEVSTGTKQSGTTSISAIVKGGKMPYSYAWSNAATTQSINNVPAGVYTLTITDADNEQLIASKFGGQQVVWDTLFNVQESATGSLSVLSQNSTLNEVNENGDPNVYGLGVSKNVIKKGESGNLEFKWNKGSDFSGLVGLVSNISSVFGDGGFGMGIGIIPKEGVDTFSGSSQEMIFMCGNNEPVFLGEVKDNLPLSIRVEKVNSLLKVYKNNSNVFSINESELNVEGNILPSLSPFVMMISPTAELQLTSCDFEVKTTLTNAAITHCQLPLQNNVSMLGSITFEFDSTKTYSWSTGENGNSIDSLFPGNYFCSVINNSSSDTDTIVQQYSIGYYPSWATLNKTTALSQGGIQSNVTSTSGFDGFAYSSNAILPSENGWCRFQLNSENAFSGVLGFSSNENFDESGVGFGIGIINNYIIILGASSEGDGVFFGEYDENKNYTFNVNFNGNEVFIIKETDDENGMLTSAIRFIINRNQNLGIGVIPFNGESKVDKVACSFGIPLNAKVTVLPGEKGSNTTSLSLIASGGLVPYSYNWSNGLTSSTLNNVPVGEYTVTVTDAANKQISLSQFGGQYASWDSLVNVDELTNHTFVTQTNDMINANEEDPDIALYGLGLSQNRLSELQDGAVHFSFDKGGEFVGIVGLASDLKWTQGGVAVAIIPKEDFEGLGASKEFLLLTEFEPVYLGEVYDSLPLDIGLKQVGDEIYVYKNGALVYQIEESVIMHPSKGIHFGDVSPMFGLMMPGVKMGRVTCDFGVHTKSKLNVQIEVRDITDDNLGGITVIANNGYAPYKYYFSCDRIDSVVTEGEQFYTELIPNILQNTNTSISIYDQHFRINLQEGHYKIKVVDQHNDSIIVPVKLGKLGGLVHSSNLLLINGKRFFHPFITSDFSNSFADTTIIEHPSDSLIRELLNIQPIVTEIQADTFNYIDSVRLGLIGSYEVALMSTDTSVKDTAEIFVLDSKINFAKNDVGIVDFHFSPLYSTQGALYISFSDFVSMNSISGSTLPLSSLLTGQYGRLIQIKNGEMSLFNGNELPTVLRSNITSNDKIQLLVENHLIKIFVNGKKVKEVMCAANIVQLGGAIASSTIVFNRLALLKGDL